MRIKELINKEILKIMEKRDAKKANLYIYFLLFFRVFFLFLNLLKTKFYLRKFNQCGSIAFTMGKPKIYNRGGFIKVGTLARFISDICPVLIDVDKGGELIIGDNCRINGVNISVQRQVLIGNNCRIGPHTIIMDSDHHDVTNRLDHGKLKAISIEDDVWVATRAMILKGVTIGKGAVVASGAVVTKNVPAYSVVAGVPAKIIKTLDPPKV